MRTGVLSAVFCALLAALPLLAAADGVPELACSYIAPSGEGFAGVAAHTHTEQCCNAAGELVCPLPELPAHIHSDGCYTEERILTCTEPEKPGHQHGEGCYSPVRGELLCAEESEEHEHTDLCYAWTQELSCAIPEGEGAHTHDESCYVTERLLSCGQLGLHVHDTSCCDADGRLICGLPQFEEHIHSAACFTETEEPAPETVESDPNADVESHWEWDSFFSTLERGETWDEALLTVARSQLGYQESSRNFDYDSEWIPGGYTRYGDWYGRPYSPWCAMFLSFCLHYADIPEEAMPRECGVRRWIDDLEAREQYVPAEDYMPKPGDLIFFDFDGDGRGDHVGLVEELRQDEQGIWRLATIEGNRTPAVERFSYRLTDQTILGYGVLPVSQPVAETEEPFAQSDDDAPRLMRRTPVRQREQTMTWKK